MSNVDLMAIIFNGEVVSFQVCREWEAKAREVNSDVRLVLIRIGVVLGKDGGALGLYFLNINCITF